MEESTLLSLIGSWQEKYIHSDGSTKQTDFQILVKRLRLSNKPRSAK
jgi:hypothetical protein